MAINQKLPPPHEPATIQTEWSSSESISSAFTSDVESSSTASTNEDEGGGTSEKVAMVMSRARACSTAFLRVPPTCCKKLSVARSTLADATGAGSIARLRRHLASLRSLLPPSARSSQARNVIADALRYKKVLRKEIQMLQKALPYAQQVNVKRLGSGGLQIGVSCNKEPGLLVALMEAIESFGLAFANVNVSCLNKKIRIDAISNMGIGERIGSLKVALMATIMRFSQQQSR